MQPEIPNSNTDATADTAVIDDVLDTFLAQEPLAPLPPHFVSNVMRHISAEPIRFRLELVDWILPTAVALFASLLLWISLSWSASPMVNDLLAQVRGRLPFTVALDSDWVLLGGTLLAGQILLVGLGLALWLDEEDDAALL